MVSDDLGTRACAPDSAYVSTLRKLQLCLELALGQLWSYANDHEVGTIPEHQGQTKTVQLPTKKPVTAQSFCLAWARNGLCQASNFPLSEAPIQNPRWRLAPGVAALLNTERLQAAGSSP